MPGGGFGENFYKNQQFNGLEEAPEGSVPYPLFLQSLKAKLVERVEFEPPSGDVAYAYAALAPGDALPGDAPPGDAAAGGEGDAARATRAVLSRQRVARLAAVRAQKLALEREEALLLA